MLVGNQQPGLELITTPKPNDPLAPFQFGQTITYEVKITDDQPIDCTKVTVAYILGHERHGHPQSSNGGLHRHDHRAAGHRSRRRGEPERDPRRLLHRQRGLTGTAEVRFTPPAPPHGGN